jgi:hypothetical protein
MERQVEAAVEIDAPPAVVWRTLVDFGAYGDWNPLLPRIRGEIAEGRRLRAVLVQTGAPPVVLLPEVVAYEPERELRWRTEPPFPGVFAAEHAFLLDPLADGTRTRFTQRERFEGALAAAMPAGLRDRVREGFVSMNDALKARVESRIPVTEEPGES